MNLLTIKEFNLKTDVNESRKDCIKCIYKIKAYYDATGFNRNIFYFIHRKFTII